MVALVLIHIKHLSRFYCLSERENLVMSDIPVHPLPVGSLAPDFTLLSAQGQTVVLHHLRGCPVILAFYPADWTPVCDDQMALYNSTLPVFRQYNAHLLGISVDSPWCHQAFSRDCRLQFPLLADFEPKGAVARAYGVYNEELGVAMRALFVLDVDGIIRWNYVSPFNINPGVDGIIQALNMFQAPRKAQFHLHQNSEGASPNSFHV